MTTECSSSSLASSSLPSSTPTSSASGAAEPRSCVICGGVSPSADTYQRGLCLFCALRPRGAEEATVAIVLGMAPRSVQTAPRATDCGAALVTVSRRAAGKSHSVMRVHALDPVQAASMLWGGDAPPRVLKPDSWSETDVFAWGCHLRSSIERHDVVSV